MEKNKISLTAQAVRRSLLPGPNGQTSEALQMELANLLDRLTELTNDEKLAPYAQQVWALIEHWYPHQAWAISQEQAKERVIAMNIAVFFLGHLANSTPELVLPRGFTIKHVVQNFEIGASALNIAVRYLVDGDTMAPQLTPGTAVLVVKTEKEEWSGLVGSVVLINRISRLSEETLGRVAEVSQAGIHLRYDNPLYQGIIVPKVDILALYYARYIVGKKVD